MVQNLIIFYYHEDIDACFLTDKEMDYLYQEFYGRELVKVVEITWSFPCPTKLVLYDGSHPTGHHSARNFGGYTEYYKIKQIPKWKFYQEKSEQESGWKEFLENHSEVQEVNPVYFEISVRRF